MENKRSSANTEIKLGPVKKTQGLLSLCDFLFQVCPALCKFLKLLIQEVLLPEMELQLCCIARTLMLAATA
jgi:hypothetical protein